VTSPPTTAYVIRTTTSTAYSGPTYRAGDTYMSGSCEEWSTSGTIYGRILWTYTGVGDTATYTRCVPN
jgi:hypothetical protein